MAVTETTTIRVRRSTQKRLAEEAKRREVSMIEVLDAAMDLLEEQQLLASMDETYRKHGDAIHEEMKDWLDFPDRHPDAS